MLKSIRFFFILLCSAVCLATWYPSLENVELAGPFRLVDAPDFQSTFLSSLKPLLQSSDGLQWTKTTMFREVSSRGGEKTAWLIVAGTAQNDDKYACSAFTKKAGAVAACQLSSDSSSSAGFKLSSCQLLAEDVPTNFSDVGLLGSGMQSVELTGSGDGVVVFCDPLWHTQLKTLSPGGKCYIRRRTRGRWVNKEVYLCNSAGRTEPCAGGFSVDLKVSNDNPRDLQMVVGLPFVPFHGRVRVYNNLLSPSFTMIDYDSVKEGFGFSVALSPQSSVKKDAFTVVSAPSVTDSPPGVYGYSFARHSNNVEPPLFQISPPENDLAAEFGGFGTTVETIQPMSSDFSVVVLVGAPYEQVAGVGVNAGRVYLYCQASGNATLQKRISALSGSRPGEMLGYAISRLTDVDGDKIDDVAISAPSIGADISSPGRVYVHRLLPGCNIEVKPFQVRFVSLANHKKCA